MFDYSKVCIIIPAYNEEKNLAKVIAEIKSLSKKLKIVVINDGSVDNTERVCLNNKVVVINIPFNIGIGGAVQTGLMWAYNNNFSTAVQIDADGQHEAKYIDDLVAGLKKNNADLTIGSRYLLKKKQLPSSRIIASIILEGIIKIVTGVKISDPTSGQRAFNKKSMKLIAESSFNESSDLLWNIILLKNNYKIVELPVNMKDRAHGKSSFNIVEGILLVTALSIAIFIETIKGKPKT